MREPAVGCDVHLQFVPALPIFPYRGTVCESKGPGGTTVGRLSGDYIFTSRRVQTRLNHAKVRFDTTDLGCRLRDARLAVRALLLSRTHSTARGRVSLHS